MTFSRLPLLAGATTFALCLTFAGFTQHAWEDYFITFRASLNLATGHGLVFQPGERIHSFTSPLGTLLPALFAVGGRDDVAVRALWLFRLVSSAALAGAIALGVRTLLRLGVTPLASTTLAIAWMCDAKTVDYTINGMESALLVFFLVWTWRAVIEDGGAWPLALGVAGLQWTRPDGFVFFAVLALARLGCGNGSATEPSPPRAALRRLAIATALGLLLYLPWLVFAWRYYGSPVPHTIVAKASTHPPAELVRTLLLYPWRLLFGATPLHDVFMPAYFFFSGWPAVLPWVARFLTVAAAGAWLWRDVRPAGRIASAAFFLGGFYVEYIPRSPWYYPGWAALGLIAWAFLLDAGVRRGATLMSVLPRISRVAAALLVAVQIALLAGVAWQMRNQQRVIEDGHRREIGRWLREQAAPRDRVYLEPLGYIGYFSGLKMLDYPGLASPEVVAARRTGAAAHDEIIAMLKPEWLVLRPDQVRSVRTARPALLEQDYRLVRVFDVRSAVDAIEFLPGRGYLNFDAVFFVFARRDRSR